MKPYEAIFIDLETTGLDQVKEEILEFGIARVDTRTWQIVEEHQGLVWTPEAKYRIENEGKLDPFVLKMHRKSGLLADLEKLLDGGVQTRTYQEVEASILEVVRGWGAKRLPVWGSSVHFDRRFLGAKMPKLNEFFHYRNIDSSSDMERLKVTNPELWKKIDEDTTKFSTLEADHRPMVDIRHSIDLERRIDKWITKPAAVSMVLPGA